MSTILLTLCVLPSTANTQNVIPLMDSLEHKLDWIGYRMSLEYWDLYTTGQADSLKFYEDLRHYVLSDTEAFERLEQATEFRNNANKRRRDLLYSMFALGKYESQPDISKLRDSLSQLNITHRSVYDSDTVTANYLYQRYRSHSDRGERERAYRAWAEIGEILSDGLGRLIRIRNQAAQKAGYNNYLALMFNEKGMDLTEYKQLLARLDSLSQPAYRDNIQAASTRLGLGKIEPWDLGYAHASVRRQVDRLFPVDSQLLYIKRSLKEIGINLDAMPIYFDLESRPGKSQFAYAFTIRSGEDMRVLANLTDGILSARTLFHEIGHTLHSALITQEQPLFRSNLEGAWSEGMGQFFAGMMDNNLWLEKYGHLSYSLANEYLKSKREEDIIYLRTTLARLQFELLAYENPNRDLNDLYWDLADQYLMLPRHEDIKPWANIIHYVTHPVYLDNYLYADMIAAQTHAYLQDHYNGVVDKPSTKAFLIQNYLRFGSRYAWQELLERGTEEPLNPDYLIKQLGLK
ncbi:MAG: M3 family metallopeptidase [bacterium]|nr:M3 family metallopeptidase [bacterium]